MREVNLDNLRAALFEPTDGSFDLLSDLSIKAFAETFRRDTETQTFDVAAKSVQVIRNSRIQ